MIQRIFGGMVSWEDRERAVKIPRSTITWVLTQCQGYWRRKSAYKKDVTGRQGGSQGDRKHGRGDRKQTRERKKD